MACAQG